MSKHELGNHQSSGMLLARQDAELESNATLARAAVSADAVDCVACRVGDASNAAAHASIISRSEQGKGFAAERSLLRLQRQYGNQYVGQVLRQASGSHDNGDMDAVERSIDQARGGGHGMDHSTRTRMESAFGADFSGVRIHTDARADSLNHAVSARAFATGQDVFFRQGEYNPGAASGRELLAHELTHVVQQNGNGIHRKMTVSEPGDAHEVEADQMARAVMQQEHAQSTDRQVVARQKRDERPLVARRATALLQRQPEALKPEDEDEKKKLHKKLDSAVVARQEDEQAPE